MTELHKHDILYYARILPHIGYYEVLELSIRTIEDTWFVGTDKRDKHAYLFKYEDIDNVIFFSRKKALEKVKEAEKNKIKIDNETYYEEY